MTPLEFLSELRKANVRVWADGDRLRYRAPEGALEPAMLRELARRKAQILEFLQQLSRDEADPEAIEKAPRDAPLPLSFGQEGLWFLSKMEADSAAYHIPFAFRMRGWLQLGALRKSVAELARRHEILRTTFTEIDGEPVQRISAPGPVPILLADLRAVNSGDREVELRRQLAIHVRHPFDLGARPPWRITLLRLADEEHVLLITMHHIITDDWSLNLFMRELGELYGAFSRGRHLDWPDPPLQYADFASWQRRRLQGELLESDLGYWLERLKGAPQALELPCDRPRPAQRSSRGASYPLWLAKARGRALEELAYQERASLFMVLLAIYQVLLCRCSAQEELLIGIPSSNRDRNDLEPVMGFFVDVLVLRSDLSGCPSFRQLLQRVREVVLEARSHPHLPFDKLVEHLEPKRDSGRTPVIQTMFAFTREKKWIEELPGLKVSQLEADLRSSMYDLDLQMWDRPQGIEGALSYSTDLFHRSTVGRWVRYFQALAESCLGDPDRPITELDLLCAAEKHQLLVEWNDSAGDEWGEAGLDELFAAQLRCTPDAVAVVVAGEQLSYRHLERRANQLANYLHARGIGPETLVGVCVERSAEMVISLLAILKVGGAYVPLDPKSPEERLAFMIEDAGVAILLSQSWLGEGLAELALPVVWLDSDAALIAAGSPAYPAVKAEPSQLAYVLYTSGSTGRPKGVAVSHGGLVNYLRWATATYVAAQGRGAPVHSSLTFDLTVTSLFTPLLSGQRVVLLPEERAVEALAATLGAAEAFSLVKLTPAHLMTLRQSLAERDLGGCAYAFVIGGEPLYAEDLAFWQSRSPQTRLLNEYGPTETVVGCVVHEACGPQRGGAVPIGRPIDNVRVYLLDRELRTVPLGVPGELGVSGLALARGYLGRPGLTASSFVPNPFSDGDGVPGERLYRTGDLARYLPDGRLEFLGRRDHQVKVRGYRIELGEIEATLRQHPALRDAVVATREWGPGDVRLVAYLVAEAGRSAAPAPLRRWLRRSLPEYMIPARFVEREALPLSAHGKVDRAALPAPEGAVDDAEADEAPATQLEELLAGVWLELLDRERVGRHQSFFELGGHSLLAMQLLARTRQALGIELPLHALFENPTVAGLAERIEATRSDDRLTALPELVPVARNQELVLSFNQQRLWFLAQLEPESPAYNIFTAVGLRGPLQIAALERALEQLVARHEVLRTTFEAADGRPRQVIRDPLRVPLPRINLRALSAAGRDRKVAQQVVREAQEPFDLERGPLLRARLLELDDQDYAFLLALHHIISDGWSVGVVIRELTLLYTAFAEGRPVPLAPLPIQYADFAHWQRRWLQGAELERQLGYWKRQLAGTPAVLDLPADRPRPAVQTYRGRHLSHSFPESLQRALEALCRQRSVTAFMLLQAAFHTLLHRYSGQGDIAIGTPIAGRNRIELEELIGFFANTLVLRMELGDDPAFTELVERSRRVVLDAHAHQDMPFEMLVEELEPERSLSYTPLFQVMFAHDVPLEVGALPGIESVPLGADNRTAKFDLSLFVNTSQGKLDVQAEYNTDLFDPTTARRQLEHFERLLAGIAADPGARLSELPLLGAAERHQLLTDWNDSAAPHPPARALAQLFAVQVRRTPAAVAVRCGDRQLSYRELNRRVNRLARVLIERGVGPNVVVALLADRSIEFLIAILAVFKAGGAYLPLDPHHPPGRHRQVLGLSGAGLVLVGEAFAETIAEALADEAPAAPPAVELLETLLAQMRPAGDLSPRSGPQDLAYVIFTSGSTGVPKGAMVEQQGMVNHLHAKVDDLTLTAEDLVAQTASQCFDISVWQFLAALLVGGQVSVMGDEITHDAALLLDRVVSEGITIFETVPSLLQILLGEIEERGAAPDLRRLRWLIPTGEALPPELCRRWFERYPEIALTNAYGPTECSDDVTHYVLRRPPAPGVANVPVGRPLANLRLYVLDRGLAPQPLGVTGELYVGGIGVGRGYLGQGPGTAAAFVPDSFSATPGGRLYRTGDLGRYLADGNIEFLGRIDHQVKVRGFRIELGEIEAALAAHPAIAKTVVLARRDEGAGSAESFLVAYVVAVDGAAAPTPDALRRHLRDRLPDYMVPAVVVALETMPLIPNGKIDRKALSRRELTAAQRRLAVATASFVAPRTWMEEQVATIWAEVLDLSRVGSGDDFFALGGHSLLAVQVISRLRRYLGVELPLRTIFEAPRLADLAQRVEQAQGAGHVAALGTLERVPRDRPLPLSYSQLRLWFLDQWEPGTPAYNLPFTIRFRGRLEERILASTFRHLLLRHEVLRTRFAVRDGEPEQVVEQDPEPPVYTVDLAGLADARRELEAQRLAAGEEHWSFQLERLPLWRAVVLRMGVDQWCLLLTFHHVITDGWSFDVLFTDLAALYTALLDATPPPLAELPFQYADYAAWQQSWLRGAVLEEKLVYWRERLGDGGSPPLELPTDRPRPALQSFRGDRESFRLGRELTSGLQAVARREGVTVFMVLLAALDTLLYRYTSQDDITVGTFIAGRYREELEAMVGFFVNTLALRVDLSGNPPFPELLDRVRQTTLGAYSHQEVPFEKILEQLQPERDLSRTPLFQVMLVLQNLPHRSAVVSDVELEMASIGGRERANFDLTLWIGELAGEGGLRVDLDYNVDLFDSATIRRLIDHFTTLLGGIVEHSDRRVSELPLASAEELQRLLVEWNQAAAVPVPENRCVHQLLEDRVAVAPEAVAVRDEDRQLSYRELNEQANRLARRLREQGIGPEVVVGILLHRSPEMIVALLSVLKAGGGYLPLDPEAPGERLAYLLEDAGATTVLTVRELLARLPATEGPEPGVRPMLVDREAAAIAAPVAGNPPPWAVPDHLAYIIYTSGSTGRPKGVAVSHRALLHHTCDAVAAYEFGPRDRLLQFAALSFDASAEEIFPSWVAGSQLVLRNDAMLASGAEFLEACRRWEITVLNLPTAYWHELAGDLETLPPALRLLIIGGEKARPDRLERWWQAVDSPPRLVNTYGPTEATVVATRCELDAALELGREVPIGRAIGPARTYVLDRDLQPTSVGVPGELHIAGAGLARGYLRQPASTAERFIPNPFSEAHGERLYKSGDRARWRPDGRLECLGRIDFQAKIRGYRIEPGEIEATLREHPALRDAVVTARRDEGEQEDRLVAYVVPGNEPVPTIGELQTHLRERLPEYMLPAAFVFLPELPTTTAGKVDRRSLPAPDRSRPELAREYVAPRIASEEALAEIVSELLGVEQVGIYDSFFDLGGHSLLATQYRSRIRELFEVEIPLQIIFETPTVASLAVTVEEMILAELREQEEDGWSMEDLEA